MWPALRAAFTAGSGFPDVFYYDMRRPGVHDDRLARRSLDRRALGEHRAVRQRRSGPGRARAARPASGPSPLEAASDELYYNRKLFKELNITVPVGCAFAGISSGRGHEVRQGRSRRVRHRRVGSRLGGPLHPERAPHRQARRRRVHATAPRRDLVEGPTRGRGVPLLQGADRSGRLFEDAQQHDPRGGAPLLHTEQKACMFPVGSWYTGRAFVPPGQGRPAQDFELGHAEQHAHEGRQGHWPEVPGRGRLAGRRRQGARTWRSR